MYKQDIFFKNPNRPVIAGYQSALPNIRLCGIHFHSELEFLYIKKGSIKCIFDSGDTIVNEGEIIFINSNLPHATENLGENLEMFMAQFRNPSVLRSSLKYLSKFAKKSAVSHYVFKADDTDRNELLDYIMNMQGTEDNQDISRDYYITANIYMVLSLLHKRKLLPVEENMIDINLINKLLPVFDYIEENYSDDIPLGTLANLINLNREYFCRLFKKASGTTLTDYLNFVRVCKAEKLLKTDMTMSEISYKVGFNSLSYFNRIFKRYNNFPPTEYRKIYSNSDPLIETLSSV